jgi:hypothetical protein
VLVLPVAVVGDVVVDAVAVVAAIVNVLVVDFDVVLMVLSTAHLVLVAVAVMSEPTETR